VSQSDVLPIMTPTRTLSLSIVVHLLSPYFLPGFRIIPVTRIKKSADGYPLIAISERKNEKPRLPKKPSPSFRLLMTGSSKQTCGVSVWSSFS
ncbi:hypothetical protein M5W88_29155, partial [Paenibacillus thiaminolyticus]|uniref:hypothetical protein n=1 Tax=Paenibacillus thiaminolyticus TaxID=49283 RepID=UPI00227E2205